MNLKQLTADKQTEIAKALVKEAGLDWNSLNDADKFKWMIEASFSVSWLCD